MNHILSAKELREWNDATYNWATLSKFESIDVSKKKEYVFGVRSNRFVLIRIADSRLTKIWTQFLKFIKVLKLDNKTIDDVKQKTSTITSRTDFQSMIKRIQNQAGEPLFSLFATTKNIIKNQENEITALKSTKIVEQNTLSSKDIEIANLKNKLTANEEELNVLKKEQGKAKIQYDGFDKKVPALEAANSKLGNEKNKLDIEIANLKQEMARNEEELNVLKKEHGKAKIQYDGLDKKVPALEAANSKLENEKNKLDIEIANLRQEMARNESELNDLKSNQEKIKVKHIAFANKITTLLSDNSKFENENNELKSEMQKLKQLINDQELSDKKQLEAEPKEIEKQTNKSPREIDFFKVPIKHPEGPNFFNVPPKWGKIGIDLMLLNSISKKNLDLLGSKEFLIKNIDDFNIALKELEIIENFKIFSAR